MHIDAFSCCHAKQQSEWSLMVGTSKICHRLPIHFVTKVLPNFDRFCSISPAIQYFKFRKSASMDQFFTFRKRVYSSYVKVTVSQSTIVQTGLRFPIRKPAPGMMVHRVFEFRIQMQISMIKCNLVSYC